MNEPKPLDYAPQARQTREGWGLRRVLVIIGCLQILLVTTLLWPGKWPDFLTPYANAVGVLYMATPLFLIVELAMCIFHPRRFPVWIPIAHALLIVDFLRGLAAHWRM